MAVLNLNPYCQGDAEQGTVYPPQHGYIVKKEKKIKIIQNIKLNSVLKICWHKMYKWDLG